MVRRIGRGLLLAVVSVGIFCLAGEVLSRAFNLPDRLNGFPRRLYQATDDERLPYVLGPGTAAVVRGFTMRANAHGMRGPEITPIPAPGVHRLAALGDSVTYGVIMREEDAFPALLERTLAARTGERFEVLNAGVPGYNTEAELAHLERDVLPLRPETVVLAFNLNDFDWTPVMGPLGILTTNHGDRIASGSLRNRSEFYLLLRWLVLTRGRVWVGNGPMPDGFETAPFLPVDVAVSRERKEYYRHPSDGRWQAMVDALGGIRDLTHAAGARLVVAIIPDGDQLDTPAPDLVPQQKLAGVCRDLALDCLDLHPAFVAQTADVRFFMDIMHPNVAGHRVIAATIADRLLARASE